MLGYAPPRGRKERPGLGLLFVFGLSAGGLRLLRLPLIADISNYLLHSLVMLGYFNTPAAKEIVEHKPLK